MTESAYDYIRESDNIPPLYAQDGKGDEAIVYVKLFDPFGRFTWYITEYDPETRDAFGLVDGVETELGYFSIEELESIPGPLPGMKRIERDLYFTPVTLGEVRMGLL